jgi:hypothetical protein
VEQETQKREAEITVKKSKKKRQKRQKKRGKTR